MPSVITLSFGLIAATYYFLRILLHATQNAHEPPAILTGVPFVSPFLHMLKQKTQLHLKLSEKYRLPIYTLRMPFFRIYVVNDTDLIPHLTRQWRTISFAAITANAGAVCGMSKRAIRIMTHDLANEKGFSISWPKYIAPSLAPGPELDAINKRSAEVLSTEMTRQRVEGTVRSGLRAWSQHMMITATTEAIYGPKNPYRDPAIVAAWKTFESGFLTFTLFPWAMRAFPSVYRAREAAAAAMKRYLQQKGHEQASGLVRKRYEHHSQWGLDLDDLSRGEVGNTFAILGNSTPCAYWVLYQIFSNEKVLSDVRGEIMALARPEEDGKANSLDLASIRTGCPILLSTFQETLRYRSVLAGPRSILEDANLDDRFLLKKGSILLIPAVVQHYSIPAWGEDADKFKHTRFIPQPGREKQNRAAYRPFGSGHTLCPGRHFASIEIMMVVAICVLNFDVVPVGGKWLEPTWERSPAGASFPIPDNDISVDFVPRKMDHAWRISYSSSDEPIKIAAEDYQVDQL
ncbi:cytochrome P450 [Xylariaceae sp. FL1272]|nr:cytochrome P450 [Xylariaceae sp. FL1272]